MERVSCMFSFRRARHLAAALAILAISVTINDCAVDRTLDYFDPQPFSFAASQSDNLLSLSDGGQVLAWVHTSVDSSLHTYTYHVIRTVPVGQTVARRDTLISGAAVYEIALSTDGRRLVAIRPESLAIWREGTPCAWQPYPRGYSRFSSVHWTNPVTFQFLSEGPFGTGIYVWNDSTACIIPVLARFDWNRWDIGSIEVDRSGNRLCSWSGGNGMLAGFRIDTVDELTEGTPLFLDQSTDRPRFWRIAEDAPDGLLYLDGLGVLWGARLDAGVSRFPILHRVDGFDVSHDGGFVFAKAWLRGQGLRLAVIPVRDLR
jgi:hypothetical protein